VSENSQTSGYFARNCEFEEKNAETAGLFQVFLMKKSLFYRKID
jgi:hypothetical protein